MGMLPAVTTTVPSSMRGRTMAMGGVVGGMVSLSPLLHSMLGRNAGFAGYATASLAPICIMFL